MPVPVSGPGGQRSCFEKIRMGFLMGAVIGGATGVLLGGIGGLRIGLRGRQLLREVGKTVAQSAGSFGVFMSVAQGIRC
uniref:Reactive oxygen species modulator 1 n=1 Tax=Strongyloides venezuelensis TaxID=75913 RepID=A0A0K0F549_STRVS